jgi:hypothetical protein
MQFRQRSNTQSPTMLEVRRGFERTVGTGIIIECNGGGIMRVLKNLQISAPGIIGVAEEKPFALGLKNSLPDFVVSLGNRRSQQVAEGG